MEFKFKLGQEVRDKLTGFTGIVVWIANHLFGCIRVGVKPQSLDKDGRVRESEGFDEAALELVSEGICPKPKISENKPPGGPDREHPGRERY